MNIKIKNIKIKGKSHLFVSAILVFAIKSYATSTNSNNQGESEKLLGQLQNKVEELTKKESKLTHDLLNQQSELATLNAKILNLETDIKLRKSFIRNRINYITHQSGADLLEQFLFSKNPSQLEQNIKIFNRISARDIQSLKGYSISLSELKFKRSEVNGRLDKLNKLQAELKLKEQKITTQLDLREKVISNIKSQVAQSISADLLKMMNHSFVSRRGKLSYPVQANIESHFGVTTDSDLHLVFINEGISLGAPSDGMVRSVSEGTILFADWIDGYKYTVIISHENHYYSVYKNLSDLQIKIDDTVNEGQVIGRAIQSIGFEIRHFNEPLDPKKWLNNKKSIAQENFHAITR